MPDVGDSPLHSEGVGPDPSPFRGKAFMISTVHRILTAETAFYQTHRERLLLLFEHGVPGGIRTHGPRIRNPVLYPAELRGLERGFRRVEGVREPGRDPGGSRRLRSGGFWRGWGRARFFGAGDRHGFPACGW